MTNKTKFITASGTGIGLLFAQVSSVFAQTSISARLSIPSVTIAAFSITSLGAFIGALTVLLFMIAGVLVFAYLVWGGVEWITSGGDKAKTQQARDRITAALIGLAIVAIAYAVIVLAQTFFGFNILDLSIIAPY